MEDGVARQLLPQWAWRCEFYTASGGTEPSVSGVDLLVLYLPWLIARRPPCPGCDAMPLNPCMPVWHHVMNLPELLSDGGSHPDTYVCLRSSTVGTLGIAGILSQTHSCAAVVAERLESLEQGRIIFGTDSGSVGSPRDKSWHYTHRSIRCRRRIFETCTSASESRTSHISLITNSLFEETSTL